MQSYSYACGQASPLRRLDISVAATHLAREGKVLIVTVAVVVVVVMMTLGLAPTQPLPLYILRKFPVPLLQMRSY